MCYLNARCVIFAAPGLCAFSHNFTQAFCAVLKKPCDRPKNVVIFRTLVQTPCAKTFGSPPAPGSAPDQRPDQRQISARISAISVPGSAPDQCPDQRHISARISARSVPGCPIPSAAPDTDQTVAKTTHSKETRCFIFCSGIKNVIFSIGYRNMRLWVSTQNSLHAKNILTNLLSGRRVTAPEPITGDPP